MKRATTLFFGALLAFGVRPAAAQAPSPGDDDLDSLLRVLQQETAIATRTRMNGDFVPGIVTVLHGDELRSQGARTVWDALSLVPGLEGTRDAQGYPSIIVRGTDFPFNSGNVKILVDSMPAARDNAGINGIVLDMPIEIVERIEVIRGPGSVVYGDFAYMGLVHIVTKKQGFGAHARIAERGAISASVYRGGRTGRGLEYSLSGSAFGADNPDAPRTSNVDDRRATGNASLSYRGLTLSLVAVTRGVVARAPGLLTTSQTHWGAEARLVREPSATWRLEARANRRSNRYVTVGSDLDGDILEAGLEAQWRGARRQTWLFDAAIQRSHIARARFAPPLPPGGIRPGQPPPPLGFTLADETLGVGSVMAQNTIDASDRLAVTLGARYDRYSKMDSRVTPRVSAVFRASERHILKAQYAEGFRAPTFFELYSFGSRNDALDFEVNRTIEANYVFRGGGTVVRLTAYHAQLLDMVYIAGVNAQRQSVFSNSREGRARGVEFELEREFGPKLKGFLNVSAFTSRDSRVAANVVQRRDSVPDGLANVGLLAAPFPKSRLSLRYRYVGDRLPATLERYGEVEGAWTQKDLGAAGVDLLVGFRVSAGGDVTYPQVLPTGTIAVPYRFPRAYAEVSYRR
jgi:iron complex outermembrane receptor protein